MQFSQILGQDRAEKMLLGAIANNRVANAYLFLGPDPGVMRDAAAAFASALNCEAGKGDSCGRCPACDKIQRGIHPDFLVVSPRGSRSIKIDQIRELISYTRFGPSTSRWKVCVVDGAQSMTTEAANSFLKTLEEPLPGIVFVLISASDVGVPLTLVSRCQKIIFVEGSQGESSEADSDWIRREISGDTVKMLKLSSRIARESEDVPAQLSSLMRSMWKSGGPASRRAVSAVSRALSSIKRRANIKLALDVMCLRLGEVFDVEKNGN